MTNFFMAVIMRSFIARNKILIGDIMLVLMTVVWGSTFYMIKIHLEFVDPVGMLFYRFGAAAILLWAWLFYKKKNIFHKPLRGLVVGIFLWLLYTPQNVGMLYTSATNSGFITGLFVAFVPPISILFFKEWPTKMRILAGFVALMGMWFLTGGVQGMNKGDVITLITPVACAFYILYVDRYVKDDSDPLVLCFQTLVTVCVLSLIWMLLFDASFAIGSTASYWVLAYFTIFATLMTFAVHLIVQQFSTPMKVAIIFALEPVFAALFAWMFIGEKLIGLQWLGGGLIVAAMILSEMPLKRKSEIQISKSENKDLTKAA
ncbi:DMT family transporter [bacterium]|nr:DMT family transporter [bacterium]